MVRVLFDTSMYSRFIEDKEGEKLVGAIIREEDFIVHNFKLIRNELRHIPKKKVVKDRQFHSKKLKIILLEIYDKIVRGKPINETSGIKQLAAEYLAEYIALKGGISGEKLENDFKIVACASLNGMDILYSEDDSSMKSEKARQAYLNVNLRHNLRTPNFISYNELKKSKI